MKRDRKKGFYSEKCSFEASILFVLCIGWVSCASGGVMRVS